MLFSEFIFLWKKTCRLNVSGGWKISQDQMLRDYINPLIGSVHIELITHIEISMIISFCKENGLSNQTTKHVYSLLNRIFKDAIEVFEMDIKFPIKPNIHRPIVSTTERKFLSPEESKKLLIEAISEPLFGNAIWLQLFCGLRVGEVQGLKWDDIDFNRKSILVRRVFNSKTKTFQNHTKNKTQPRIPMPDVLCEYLLRNRDSLTGFVCQSSSGQHMSRNSYASALTRICEKLDLKIISSHELRHSCSEIWINSGASTEDIRRLFNHKDLTSTKNYIHRTDLRLQDLAVHVNSGLSLHNIVTM